MNRTSTSAGSRAQRRAALLDDPRFDWARTPRMRRRLVITMSLIIALEAVVLLVSGAYFADDPIFVLVPMALMALLVAGFVFCFGVLKASTRGVEELDPDQLDERQMQVRGVVYTQAYKIGASLVIFLLAAAVIWSAIADTYPPSLVIITVMLVTFHVALVLPTLVAAWHKKV